MKLFSETLIARLDFVQLNLDINVIIIASSYLLSTFTITYLFLVRRRSIRAGFNADVFGVRV